MPALPQGKPKLVNRGGAGLLSKKEGTVTPSIPVKETELQKAKERISPGLLQVTMVKISDLVSDPMNARLHPERNLEAIKSSLTLYGQQKPLVVRRGTNVVIAGNGTLEAAKALGWEDIAVSYTSLDDSLAAGFGLADNRSAELAKWDFEVVKRLDLLIAEAGGAMVGWSRDELEVLRMAEFTPPPIEGEDKEAYEGDLVIKFTEGLREVVQKAIDTLRDICLAEDKESPSEALAIKLICEEWLAKGGG